MLNAEGRGRVSRFHLLRRARVVHAPTGRVAQQGTRRENDPLYRWRVLIGCPDFYLILSLNSIISLQINFLFFYFYTKIHDFFLSINRDLVHLIWTQKKNQVFHSLNLIIIFLLVFIFKF